MLQLSVNFQSLPLAPVLLLFKAVSKFVSLLAQFRLQWWTGLGLEQTRFIQKVNKLLFWQITTLSPLCSKVAFSWLSLVINFLCSPISHWTSIYVMPGWFPGILMQASCMFFSFLCFTAGRTESAKTGSLEGLIVQLLPAPQTEPKAHTVTAR